MSGGKTKMKKVPRETKEEEEFVKTLFFPFFLFFFVPLS
jgi:hypothetical protein